MFKLGAAGAWTQNMCTCGLEFGLLFPAGAACCCSGMSGVVSESRLMLVPSQTALKLYTMGGWHCCSANAFQLEKKPVWGAVCSLDGRWGGDLLELAEVCWLRIGSAR